MNTTKITHVAAGILIQPDGQFLLGSRPEGKPYAGWWEFPGGKLEAGETALDALKRELDEEMGITVEIAHPWLVQVFSYPHATVRLNFFKVTRWVGEPHPHEGQTFAWQVPGALTVDPVLPANTPILRGLQLPTLLAFSNVAELGAEAWLSQLEIKLQAGLHWLVLREPQLDDMAFAELAQQTLALSETYGCRVLLHGTINLAHELGAAGVHLPAHKLMQTIQRPKGWCGASVHNVTELTKAAELGLDYVVLGTIKPSLSHPGSPTLGWSGFHELVSQGWPFPIYGIGGLAESDLSAAHAAGGQGIAAIRAAWQ